jgi:hypothetical protein
MEPSTIGGIMKALIATAALVMAGWTLLPGSALNPGAAPKERNYSVPVQNSYRCECTGERGCISRTQCVDTGGRCGKDC